MLLLKQGVKSYLLRLVHLHITEGEDLRRVSTMG